MSDEMAFLRNTKDNALKDHKDQEDQIEEKVDLVEKKEEELVELKSKLKIEQDKVDIYQMAYDEI